MDTEIVADVNYPAQVRAGFRIDPASAFHPGKAGRRPQYKNHSSYSPSTVSAWSLSHTRRAIDCAVAALALAVFLPLMLLVALAVLLSSPGPILFTQSRMGRNGLAFTVYKFRSMRTENRPSSPITVTGDNRITPIGKFLRKYKLDELPQFWNVLRGDMGLVGPRPKLPHHEALHMPFRPGITGPATLAFRYEEEMLREIPREHLDAYYDRFVKPRKAEIDWAYMQSASLKTDLRILFQTAKSCVCSAESSYQANLPEFSDAAHEFVLRSAVNDRAPSFQTISA